MNTTIRPPEFFLWQPDEVDEANRHLIEVDWTKSPVPDLWQNHVKTALIRQFHLPTDIQLQFWVTTIDGVKIWNPKMPTDSVIVKRYLHQVPPPLKDVKDLEEWITSISTCPLDTKCRLDMNHDSLKKKLDECISVSVAQYGLYSSLNTHSITSVNDVIEWLETPQNFVGSLLFGVSGCGKTRTVLELLCQQFGFFLTCDNRGNGGSPVLKRVIEEANNSPSLIDGARRSTAAGILKRFLVSLHILFERVQLVIPKLSPLQWLFCQLYPKLLTVDGSDALERIHQELFMYDVSGLLLPLMQRVQNDTGMRPLYCVDEAQVLLAQTRIDPVRGMLGSMLDCLVGGETCSFVLSGTGFGLTLAKDAVTSGTLKTLTKNDLVFKLFTEFQGFTSVESMCDFLQLGHSHKFQYDGPFQLLLNNVSNVAISDVFECLRGRRRFFVSFLAFLDSSPESDLEDLLRMFISQQTKPLSSNSTHVLTVYQTIVEANQKFLALAANRDNWPLSTQLPLLMCRYLSSLKVPVSDATSKLVELAICQLDRMTDDNQFLVSLNEPLVIESLISFFTLEKLVLLPLQYAANASAAGFLFEVCQAMEWKALFAERVTLTELFQEYGFELVDGPLPDPFNDELQIVVPEIEAKYGLQMPLIEPNQDGIPTKSTFAGTKPSSGAADLVARLRVGDSQTYIVLSIQVKLRRGHIGHDALLKTEARISRDEIANQLRILACFPGSYEGAVFLKDKSSQDVIVSICGAALMEVAMSDAICEHLLSLHNIEEVSLTEIRIAQTQSLNLRKLKRVNYRE